MYYISPLKLNSHEKIEMLNCEMGRRRANIMKLVNLNKNLPTHHMR